MAVLLQSDFDVVREVTDELPLGIWVARAPSGEEIYSNARFAEILGTDARGDVAVGQYAQPYGICDLEGRPYPEDRMPFVLALRERATVEADDIVIHRADGGRVHVRAFAKPIFDGAGEITHVVIAFIDITPEVTAIEARRESERRLMRAQRMESIGTLAGGIAHDFNNLLAVIKLVAAELSEGEADPDRRASLGMIDELTGRAATLTRSLLGFAGRGKHLAQRVSLAAVVGSLREIIRRTLGAGLEVTIDAPDAGCDVIGDFSQLEQVLMNLVVNARDAIGQRPGAGRLAVRVAEVTAAANDAATALGPTPPPSPNHVLLEITDDGPGVPRALRDRIFEPYFSTKGTPTRGAGLGLATVYGIVDSHGGVIEVADGPRGVGTTIRVLLPAAPPAPRAPAPTRRSAGPTPLGSASGTLLLVDDEPYVRGALRTALERIGYTVVEARDGVEALAVFGAQHADLDGVVLDMTMPRMGGRETYLGLRAIEPDVPVLLVTGHAANEEVQAVLDLGVRGYLAKPCGVEALAAAVARILEPPPAR